MAEYDSFNNLKIDPKLAATTIATNITTNTGDISQAGFESVTFGLHTSTITDGVYTVRLQTSPDNLTYTDIDSGDIIGVADNVSGSGLLAYPLVIDASTAPLAAAVSNKVFKIGTNTKVLRVRMTITSASTSTGGAFSAFSVQGAPHSAPIDLS